MAKNPGTLVIAPIRPHDSEDKFPVVDANEILGGVHSVPTLTKRNAIPDERRMLGMPCYVQNQGKYFYLKDGITNDDWVDFSTLSINTNTETFVITETMLSAKTIELMYIPSTIPIVSIVHGVTQKYEEDFYVDSKFLKWDNRGLEHVLDIGDQITIVYKVLTNE